MAEFATGVITARGAPGLQKVSLPFQPDAMIFFRMGTHKAVPGYGAIHQAVSNDASLSYGVMADNVGMIEQGAVGHARTTSQGSGSHCILVPKALGGLAARAAVDAILADGVRLNWDVCESQFLIFYWAVEGVRAGVASDTYQDNVDEGAQSLEVGFEPDFLAAIAAFPNSGSEDSASIGVANATQQATMAMGGAVSSATSDNGGHYLATESLCAGINSGPSITNLIDRSALTSTGCDLSVGPLSDDAIVSVLMIRGLKSSIVGTTINGLGAAGNKDTLAATGWLTETLLMMHNGTASIGGSGGIVARGGVGAAHVANAGISCYSEHRVVSGQERWYSQPRNSSVLTSLDVSASSVLDASQKLLGFASSPAGNAQLETLDSGPLGNIEAVEVQLAGGNVPPNPPRQLFPTDGEAFRRDIANDLEWEHRDDNDDDQYASRVQVREQGAVTLIIDSTQITAEEFYTIPAGTLVDERDYEWRGQTQDPAEEWGEFSSWEPFTAGTPPPAPTITSPAVDGSVVDTASYPIQWTAGQQARYQLGVGSSLANPTQYYDSGVVIQSASRQHNAPFPTNSVSRTIFIRIQWNGLWSDWAARQVNIQYTPPDTPALAITPDFPESAISIGVNNDPRTDWERAMQELAPLAWWRLGEAAGATTAKDESGNGHDGTYQGGVTLGQPSLVATDDDTAMAVDASNEGAYSGAASIPDFGSSASGHSIGCWVRTNVDRTNAYFVRSGEGPSLFTLVWSNNSIRVYHRTAAGDLQIVTSLPTVVGAVYHAVGVLRRSSNDLEVWLDGQLSSSKTVPSDRVVLLNELSAGSVGGGVDWDGTVDEVAAWDRALSAQEIADLYEAGATGYPGEPTVISNELWRRETADPVNTEKLLDGDLPRMGAYTDWAVALNGTDYEYKAIARGDNGTDQASGWLGGGDVTAGETWIVGGGSETASFDGELSGG